MAEQPRKSRRISSKRSRALHIEDNREVHIPAQSNTCRTAHSEGSDIKEKIQEGIQAAIPDKANYCYFRVKGTWPNISNCTVCK